MKELFETPGGVALLDRCRASSPQQCVGLVRQAVAVFHTDRDQTPAGAQACAAAALALLLAHGEEKEDEPLAVASLRTAGAPTLGAVTAALTAVALATPFLGQDRWEAAAELGEGLSTVAQAMVRGIAVKELEVEKSELRGKVRAERVSKRQRFKLSVTGHPQAWFLVQHAVRERRSRPVAVPWWYEQGRTWHLYAAIPAEDAPELPPPLASFATIDAARRHVLSLVDEAGGALA